MIFCCGHFQSVTIILYTSLAYGILRTVFDRRERIARSQSVFPWEKLPLLLLFMVWGALPLLSHLIPALEFLKRSNRSGAGLTYDNFNGIFSVNPGTLYQLLFPSWGLSQGQSLESAFLAITDQVHLGNDFLAAAGYAGVWLPFLIWAAFQGKEKKIPGFFLGAALLAILASWGRNFPLHRALCALLPGFSLSRGPYRFLELYVLAACVLAAYGYQSLEGILRRRPGPWAVVGTLYAVGLSIPAFLRPENNWREILGLSFGLIGLSLLRWGGSKWEKHGLTLIQGALILPLLLGLWWNYTPVPASNLDFSARFPALTYAGQQAKDRRYYFDTGLTYPLQPAGEARPFPQDSAMALGIRNCGGYQPLLLSNYSDLTLLPKATYLKTMAVHGLIFAKDLGVASEFTHRTFGTDCLYEFIQAPSYVKAPYQVRMGLDGVEDLQAMARPDFDPEVQAISKDHLPGDLLSRLTGQRAHLSYQFLEKGTDEQRFKIGLDKDNLLVFSEITYPGWKAFLDGRPVDLLTADHAFRALFVPAGEHQVEFRFSPWWVSPLLFLMAAWILSVILYGTVLVIQRRRFTIETNKRS